MGCEVQPEEVGKVSDKRLVAADRFAVEWALSHEDPQDQAEPGHPPEAGRSAEWGEVSFTPQMEPSGARRGE